MELISEEKQRMKIGELATLSGLSVDTIRFYEKQGLLPPPNRGDVSDATQSATLGGGVFGRYRPSNCARGYLSNSKSALAEHRRERRSCFTTGCRSGPGSLSILELKS